MRSPAFLSLYFAVFVGVLGISMVSPLLPVYAEELGANGVWLGLTFSAFAITQAIFGPYAGRLSDRYGRKPFILAGLSVYVVAAIGYLTAETFYQVIAFRMFSGIGTSFIFSVSRAYIGDMTPPGQEGRWLGTFATGDIIGFGTGPLIAGLIRQSLGFEAVFVAMALLLSTSAFIVLIWLPARPPVHSARRVHKSGQPLMSFRSALGLPIVMAVTVLMLITSLSNGAIMSFLSVLLEDHIGAAPFFVGAAFATQDISAGIAQPLMGRIADRRSRRVMVAIGLTVSATFVGVLGLMDSYVLVLTMLLLMGVGSAVAQVATGAMQVVAGRQAGMGTVLGLGSAGNGIGIVIGSVVGGLLVDAFSIRAPFFFAAAMTIVGVLVFLLLTRGVATSEPRLGTLRLNETLPEASGAGGS